jgi:hypothetical protein
MADPILKSLQKREKNAIYCEIRWKKLVDSAVPKSSCKLVTFLIAADLISLSVHGDALQVLGTKTKLIMFENVMIESAQVS